MAYLSLCDKLVSNVSKPKPALLAVALSGAFSGGAIAAAPPILSVSPHYSAEFVKATEFETKVDAKLVGYSKTAEVNKPFGDYTKTADLADDAVLGSVFVKEAEFTGTKMAFEMFQKDALGHFKSFNDMKSSVDDQTTGLAATHQLATRADAAITNETQERTSAVDDLNKKLASATSGGLVNTGVGADAIAVGKGARALLGDDLAFGNGATAMGGKAIAIGNSANAFGPSSLAIGDGAFAANGGVALGQNSSAGKNQVSVGNAQRKIFRKITNVANGDVDLHSTDAVTGRQIHALQEDLGKRIQKNANNAGEQQELISILNAAIVGYETPLADAVKFNANKLGELNLVQIGNQGKTVVIRNVGEGEIKAGGTDAVNAGQLHGVRESVRDLAGKVSQLESRSTGTGGSSLISQDGSTGDIAIGNDKNKITVKPDTAGNAVIAGVASGTDTDHAVNVGQMNDAVAHVIQNVTDVKNEVNQNVVIAKSEVMEHVAGVKADITADMTQRITTANNGVAKGADRAVTYNRNVNADARADAAGSWAAGKGSEATGVNATALNGGVASGKNATAVGLDATASAYNTVAMGVNAQVTAANSVAVGVNSKTDRANTFAVGNVGGERQMVNVAAGTQDTDGVNVAQLNKGLDGVRGDMANVHRSLKGDINKLRKDMSAGIASSMAMAGIPQAYMPGKALLGAGVANYGGYSALAIGGSVISGNGHWITRVQAGASTQGSVSGSVGVGYQW